MYASRGGSVLKLLKISFAFLVIVLIFWGLVHVLEPQNDGVFRVVIDPGHGGKDPGAVVGEIYEKDINLAIALMVRDKLSEQNGVEILMTREDDSFLTLDDRAELANKKDADLYVSIHANALDDTSYSGLITFYHTDVRFSEKPAKLIQYAVSEETGAIDRGTRTENYVVLRKTDMPAVLIETGFMTCPEELVLLIDNKYQMKMALGITKGILAYAGK